jgi:HD-GYP domain-containing protein (c-di-GMP phosphodiesterase class II)
VWDRPGPLREAELEQVRLHAYHTERVLRRAGALAAAGALAGLHHERLDGSGYHRGAHAGTLPAAARVLAAADAFAAMTEPRGYRAALSPEQAADVLQSEAVAGSSDRSPSPWTSPARAEDRGPSTSPTDAARWTSGGLRPRTW